MEETKETRPDLMHHTLQPLFGASPFSVPKLEPSSSNRLDLPDLKASEIRAPIHNFLQNFRSPENNKRPAGTPLLHPNIPPASPYLLPSPYLQIPAPRPPFSMDVFMEDRNGSSHSHPSSTIVPKDMDVVKRRRRRKKRHMENDNKPEIRKSNGGDKATMIGRSVQGVVDGVFDSGYLISVRIGESDFNFRGVVFGPGLMVPVSEKNDVAPAAMQVARYPTVVGLPAKESGESKG